MSLYQTHIRLRFYEDIEHYKVGRVLRETYTSISHPWTGFSGEEVVKQLNSPEYFANVPEECRPPEEGAFCIVGIVNGGCGMTWYTTFGWYEREPGGPWRQCKVDKELMLEVKQGKYK